MLSVLGNTRVLLAIAWAVTIVGMFAAHQRAERFQAEAEKATQLAETFQNALREQNKVAAECDRATQGLIAAQAAQERRMNEAVAVAKQFRDQLNATREALRLQQEADRAIPECKAVLDVQLNVCPGYVGSMRERATGLQGSRGESPRPGEGGN